MGQFGTQLGHPPANLLGQFRAAQFLVGRQARDVQALGQLLDLRQGRFDEQGEAGAIVAQDHGLFEERVLEQFGLDRLGGDVLAVEGDDDVLEPVGDEQVAILIQTSDIAGAQPPVVERGLGGLRLVPVALHDVLAPVLHLAVVGDADPGTVDRASGGTEFVSCWAVEAHQWAGLGESVALTHEDPTGCEELLNLLAQWGTTGGQHLLGATDGVANGVQHQGVSQLVLHLENAPGGAAGLTDVPPLLAHLQRPVEDPLLGRGVGDLLLSHRHDLLVELGNTHEQRRTHLSEHRTDRLGVGDEGVEAAVTDERHRPTPLIGVGEGQEAQRVVGGLEVEEGVERRDLGQHTLVGEHDSLGGTRGPGGVDEGSDVVGASLSHPLGDNRVELGTMILLRVTDGAGGLVGGRLGGAGPIAAGRALRPFISQSVISWL